MTEEDVRNEAILDEQGESFAEDLPGETLPSATAESAEDGFAGGGPSFSNRQTARIRELLTRLYAIRKAAKFYPVDHPAVNDSVEALLAVVTSFHAEGVDVPLTFFEGELLLGEQLLTEDSILFDQLIRDMTSIGAGSVTFLRGLDLEELRRAVPILAADASELEEAGGLAKLAEAALLEHVLIGDVKVVERGDGGSEGEPSELAQAAYGDALGLMRELERVIRTNQTMSVGAVRGVVKSLVDSVLHNRHAMLELSGLRSYDEYTFYHSVNVAILSLALGSRVTQEARFLSSLGVGALLHDIGKMAVDVGILNKPGSLTTDEWAKVRKHPVWGAQMAAAIHGLDKSSVVVILEHHLRYDLSGYPKRPMRRQQHLASRIVAVADAYDAMTSRRSYSAARLQDQAMMLLAKNVGTGFDPGLVKLFIGLMGIYPPRSAVRLSTGELAVVMAGQLTDVSRPTVRVIASPGGEAVKPFDVDLGDPSAEGRTVVGCVDPDALNVDVGDYV